MNAPKLTAEGFNARHPVGTPVLFWPGAKTGTGRKSKTRTPAWAMNVNDAVVSVEGYPGGIALTHIEVQEVTDTDRIEKIREKAEDLYTRPELGALVQGAKMALTYTDEDLERAAEALWRNQGRSPEHHEWSDVPRWLQAANRESAIAALESFGARRAE